MKPDLRPHTLKGAEVPDAPAESGKLVFVTMAIHMFVMYSYCMNSTGARSTAERVTPPGLDAAP